MTEHHHQKKSGSKQEQQAKERRSVTFGNAPGKGGSSSGKPKKEEGGFFSFFSKKWNSSNSSSRRGNIKSSKKSSSSGSSNNKKGASSSSSSSSTSKSGGRSSNAAPNHRSYSEEEKQRLLLCKRITGIAMLALALIGPTICIALAVIASQAGSKRLTQTQDTLVLLQALRSDMDYSRAAATDYVVAKASAIAFNESLYWQAQFQNLTTGAAGAASWTIAGQFAALSSPSASSPIQILFNDSTSIVESKAEHGLLAAIVGGTGPAPTPASRVYWDRRQAAAAAYYAANGQNPAVPFVFDPAATTPATMARIPNSGSGATPADRLKAVGYVSASEEAAARAVMTAYLANAYDDELVAMNAVEGKFRTVATTRGATFSVTGAPNPVLAQQFLTGSQHALSREQHMRRFDDLYAAVLDRMTAERDGDRVYSYVIMAVAALLLLCLVALLAVYFLYVDKDVQSAEFFDLILPKRVAETLSIDHIRHLRENAKSITKRLRKQQAASQQLAQRTAANLSPNGMRANGMAMLMQQKLQYVDFYSDEFDALLEQYGEDELWEEYFHGTTTSAYSTSKSKYKKGGGSSSNRGGAGRHHHQKSSSSSSSRHRRKSHHHSQQNFFFKSLYSEFLPVAWVAFMDVVGFTVMCRNTNAEVVIRVLNELFSILDSLSDDYKVEKIKTIGDSFMCAKLSISERDLSVMEEDLRERNEALEARKKATAIAAAKRKQLQEQKAKEAAAAARLLLKKKKEQQALTKSLSASNNKSTGSSGGGKNGSPTTTTALRKKKKSSRGAMGESTTAGPVAGPAAGATHTTAGGDATRGNNDKGGTAAAAAAATAAPRAEVVHSIVNMDANNEEEEGGETPQNTKHYHNPTTTTSSSNRAPDTETLLGGNASSSTATAVGAGDLSTTMNPSAVTATTTAGTAAAGPTANVPTPRTAQQPPEAAPPDLQGNASHATAGGPPRRVTISYVRSFGDDDDEDGQPANANTSTDRTPNDSSYDSSTVLAAEGSSPVIEGGTATKIRAGDEGNSSCEDEEGDEDEEEEDDEGPVDLQDDDDDDDGKTVEENNDKREIEEQDKKQEAFQFLSSQMLDVNRRPEMLLHMETEYEDQDREQHDGRRRAVERRAAAAIAALYEDSGEEENGHDEDKTKKKTKKELEQIKKEKERKKKKEVAEKQREIERQRDDELAELDAGYEERAEERRIRQNNVSVELFCRQKIVSDGITMIRFLTQALKGARNVRRPKRNVTAAASAAAAAAATGTGTHGGGVASGVDEGGKVFSYGATASDTQAPATATTEGGGPYALQIEQAGASHSSGTGTGTAQRGSINIISPLQLQQQLQQDEGQMMHYYGNLFGNTGTTGDTTQQQQQQQHTTSSSNASNMNVFASTEFLAFPSAGGGGGGGGGSTSPSFAGGAAAASFGGAAAGPPNANPFLHAHRDSISIFNSSHASSFSPFNASASQQHQHQQAQPHRAGSNSNPSTSHNHNRGISPLLANALRQSQNSSHSSGHQQQQQHQHQQHQPTAAGTAVLRSASVKGLFRGGGGPDASTTTTDYGHSPGSFSTSNAATAATTAGGATEGAHGQQNDSHGQQAQQFVLLAVERVESTHNSATNTGPSSPHTHAAAMMSSHPNRPPTSGSPHNTHLLSLSSPGTTPLADMGPVRAASSANSSTSINGALQSLQQSHNTADSNNNDNNNNDHQNDAAAAAAVNSGEAPPYDAPSTMPGGPATDSPRPLGSAAANAATASSSPAATLLSAGGAAASNDNTSPYLRMLQQQQQRPSFLATGAGNGGGGWSDPFAAGPPNTAQPPWLAHPDVHGGSLSPLAPPQQRTIDVNTVILPFLEMRCGLHVGPVASGIVGFERPLYDLFGDTVNTAARLESSGRKNKVHILATTADLLMCTPPPAWLKDQALMDVHLHGTSGTGAGGPTTTSGRHDSIFVDSELDGDVGANAAAALAATAALAKSKKDAAAAQQQQQQQQQQAAAQQQQQQGGAGAGPGGAYNIDRAWDPKNNPEYIKFDTSGESDAELKGIGVVRTLFVSDYDSHRSNSVFSSALTAATTSAGAFAGGNSHSSQPYR